MSFKFKRRVLSNGMTLIFEKRDLPVVSVAFAVRNGGINETLKEKGISHYIEHMLYKGTPSRSSHKIAQEIEKNGGILNGFTDEAITAYWCKVPSKHLDVALDVLSDMMKNPKFDKTELEKERKVIFEEIKMRRDNPRVYVFDEIKNHLYEKPFGPSLIGTEENMNKINRDEIISKFEEIYVPENMILSVVGDADFEKLVLYVEKNFEKKKGSVPQIEIRMKNGSDIEERVGIDQSNLILAHHVPLVGDKKSYAAKVLNVLMGGGMSSRLFSEIREKRNLAYAIKGDCEINEKFAYNLIYAGTTKENVEVVKKLILDEYEKVAKELSEDELKEVKEQIIGNHQISMEDSESQMVSLLYSEINGNAEEFYEFEKNISEVKLEDVKKLASKVKDNFSFFALIPKE